MGAPQWGDCLFIKSDIVHESVLLFFVHHPASKWDIDRLDAFELQNVEISLFELCLCSCLGPTGWTLNKVARPRWLADGKGAETLKLET